MRQINRAIQIARGSMVTNLPASARDAGLIPGPERSLGVGSGNLLQDSFLEDSMDRGSSWAPVCGVAKSQTQLSTHAIIILTLSTTRCPHSSTSGGSSYTYTWRAPQTLFPAGLSSSAKEAQHGDCWLPSLLCVLSRVSPLVPSVPPLEFPGELTDVASLELRGWRQ